MLINLKPIQTAVIPNSKLAALYNSIIIGLPVCNNSKFSNEKAEKVVKPPQIPVAKNSFQLWLKASFFKLRAITIPIMKQPLVLTNNVATGKSF